MNKLSHPERFGKRKWSTPVHRETEVARRQGNITEVYERWSAGAGSLYELRTLPCGAGGPDDVPVGDLGLDNDTYVHFGEEEGVWLSLGRQKYLGKRATFRDRISCRKGDLGSRVFVEYEPQSRYARLPLAEPRDCCQSDG